LPAALSVSNLCLFMILTSLTRFRDVGLLLLRIGLGLVFIFHGWPKLVAGPDRWVELGGAMAHLGITFYPLGWGLLAALGELGGGILFLLGFLFRPACAVLFFTMLVATIYLIQSTGNFTQWSHPVSLAIVFASMFLIGPGRYSLDRS